jgi:hypothetical protein
MVVTRGGACIVFVLGEEGQVEASVCTGAQHIPPAPCNTHLVCVLVCVLAVCVFDNCHMHWLCHCMYSRTMLHYSWWQVHQIVQQMCLTSRLVAQPVHQHRQQAGARLSLSGCFQKCTVTS